MSAKGTEIAGKMSLWLTGLFAVSALPLPALNAIQDTSIELPVELAVPYLFGTLTVFMTYVYGRLEENRVQQDELLRKPSQGIDVFHTSEDFIEKLIEITVGAETVSTLNLSPARGEHPDLDTYFQRVHTYIKARRSPLRSFRSIASIDNREKLAFLLARSHELVATGKASFAVFDQSSIGPLPHPLSLHITVKNGETLVFLFPPVDLTGAMDCVLIRNEAVARVMLDYFNTLWHKSVVVNEGKRVRRSGLEYLAGIDPNLRHSPHFGLLEESAL